MDHPDALRQVAAFHRTFKHPIEPAPTIPDETRCKLRVSLLAEEVRELEQAIADRDLTEIADALCDIQYVLSGAILEFGLADKFKALFEEVQRSNMSKACSTREEAEQTMAYYKTERGFDSYVVEEDGRFLVYRKEDNKTLKSVAYSPADLQAILKP
jgi:predicted HAD superfamily Cof-like phosphohydrolase